MNWPDYFLRHYGIVIQILGLGAMGLLVAYGLNWLCERIPEDADVFGAIADEIASWEEEDNDAS